MRICEFVCDDSQPEFQSRRECILESNWPGCSDLATHYVRLKGTIIGELPIHCCAYHLTQIQKEQIEWQAEINAAK
jgi:hypothetical protein